ncbi:MAG: 2-dehydro-3-deoxy-6-phosphogalactonate aldolase [Burkholderiaceae bacterium]
MNRTQALFGDAAPLVAILRGVDPTTVIAVADALLQAGIRAIEVPLNSPAPFDSIAALVAHAGRCVAVGAGTVRDVASLDRLAATGASLCLMPHVDVRLIAHAKALGLTVIPGVMTPTEAFAALDSGADALKLFPMELIGAAGVRALKAVLPAQVPLIGVGGIDAGGIPALRAAGCDGFGLGGWLYKPGASPADVRSRAEAALSAWKGDGGKMVFLPE